ncbi:Gonadotropin-releasing hormone receptor [Toxocara canis]|nr:Gonadotropin-releasing hormone receptor [Toxocara canis]
MMNDGLACNDSCSGSQQPTEQDFEPVNRLTADLVEILIYLLCLCTGGPLNVISFIRSTRLYRSDQRNRSQILLLRIHLNIADLLTMFIYTPTQIIWMTTFQWYGGDVLCRVCKFFYTFSFYLNSFVIAGIAIDRVCSAYKINSLKAYESAYKRVHRTLIAAYAGATLFSIPQLFIFRVFQPLELTEFRQCTPVWTIYAYEYDLRIQSPSITEREKHLLAATYMQVHRWEKVYNMAHLLLVFWIPTLIIAFSYVVIICKLNSLKRERTARSPQMKALLPPAYRQERSTSYDTAIAPTLPNGDAEPCANGVTETNLSKSQSRVGPIARRTIHKATRNAKRQAALILLAYLTLWSPYNVMAVMNTFATSTEGREMILVTLPFLNALIVVNPVVNPIIYGLSPSRSKTAI